MTTKKDIYNYLPNDYDNKNNDDIGNNAKDKDNDKKTARTEVDQVVIK